MGRSFLDSRGKFRTIPSLFIQVQMALPIVAYKVFMKTKRETSG